MNPFKKYFIIFGVFISFIGGFVLYGSNKKAWEEKKIANEIKKEEKIYVGPEQLLEDSFTLAKLIFESDFRPTFLIALWRGGAPIGIVVEEYFSYKKVSIDKHLAVRTSAYDHDKLKNKVEVFNLDYVARTIKNNDKLLIVDDVIDSGSTMKKVIAEIKTQCGSNAPHDIRIAAVYYKPKKSSIIPDYYLYETDAWIVFPHAIEGMSISEIKKFKGEKLASSLQ